MGKSKEFIGIVLSNKMKKTIVVRTMHKAKHYKYGRVIKKYNKFKVHDEKNQANIGDMVSIKETRPLSKEKCYMLVAIVKKVAAADIEIKEEAL
jgi:small subunit ribosomal protein S17